MCAGADIAMAVVEAHSLLPLLLPKVVLVGGENAML